MAALLFKLEACTQLQLNKVAVTSTLYQWNRSKKSAERDILKNINFKQPKKEDLAQKILKTYRLVIIVSKILNQYCNFIKRGNIRLCKKNIAPNGIFFTSVNLDDSAENNDFSSQTGTADESDLTCLPEPLSCLFDSTAVNLGNNDLTSLCKDIYSQYHQAYRQKYNFKL